MLLYLHACIAKGVNTVICRLTSFILHITRHTWLQSWTSFKFLELSTAPFRYYSHTDQDPSNCKYQKGAPLPCSWYVQLPCSLNRQHMYFASMCSFSTCKLTTRFFRILVCAYDVLPQFKLHGIFRIASICMVAGLPVRVDVTSQKGCPVEE